MKGVLLFAFDNEQIDYKRMACICAERVKRFWDLPVCLVTDHGSPGSSRLPKGITFWKQVERTERLNTKSYPEYGTAMSYWNANRCDAFDLTPFQQTIVLDTDFLVSTTNVVDAWNGRGVALSKTAHSVDGTQLPADAKWISQKSRIEMYWATVLCFDKSPVAAEFFSTWKQVVDLYSVYASVYGFEASPLRNDFAVTIALQKLKGSAENGFFDLPYSIPTLMPGSTLESLDPLIAFKRSEHRDEYDIDSYCSDLHVLNKKSILECAVDTNLTRSK